MCTNCSDAVSNLNSGSVQPSITLQAARVVIQSRAQANMVRTLVEGADPRQLGRSTAHVDGRGATIDAYA